MSTTQTQTSPRSSSYNDITSIGVDDKPRLFETNVSPCILKNNNEKKTICIEKNRELEFEANVSPHILPNKNKNKKENKKISLDLLIQRIQEVLGGDVNTFNKKRSGEKSQELIEEVGELLRSYDEAGGEWKRYAFWSENQRYTRNLIATNHQTFSLMTLCWNPGMTSPVHSHANSECWLVCLQGEVVEKQFYQPKEDEKQCCANLCLKSETIVRKGDVAFINDSIGIHRVYNPSEDVGAVTLHLYCPPYQTCNVFKDEKAGSYECSSSFYSEFGKKI